ncbi:MAG: hypothetical protein Q8R45_13950 [Brevundimonas sp.]|uniref:hypothetical protein n=1 Tax=Brevundimonas sp. TaxID=1871086 RepID=UPI00273622B9|nr:hypothetical protein [Brevundimonas sp.]MDP3658051.1 hypothetical protein [Brevundimonas sp.]MDZ4067315.1 hypothetical protein [Tabrizicola sp.]
MLAIVEFLFWLGTATLFVGSSGLWYRERHGASLILVAIAGAIALVSTLSFFSGILRGDARLGAHPSIVPQAVRFEPSAQAQNTAPIEQVVRPNEALVSQPARADTEPSRRTFEFSERSTDAASSDRSGDSDSATSRPKIEMNHRGS